MPEIRRKSVVHRRKSQLFLTSISPVTNTYDELVKEKLESGKFPTTKTGIIKIIGMFCCLAWRFFLDNRYVKTPRQWYPYLFPISLGVTIFTQFVLFFIFAWGLTVKRPGLWIHLDVLLILLFSLNTIVSSVITLKECSDQGSLTKIPGPFGIAGGVILMVSCGAIFLMYRYIEEDEPTIPIPRSPRPRTSGSMFA
ncbi:hypothetical protein NQ318_014159 [Aromia moschata]|uniref:Uncharacterized protein n=1 Tax=Aromia moschata TaxID=1265417 RepID=A0AAV8Y729_9CUCU|nr:hypothetical protein NQ318_014159 [Aromia moschata]